MDLIGKIQWYMYMYMYVWLYLQLYVYSYSLPNLFCVYLQCPCSSIIIAESYMYTCSTY